MKESEFYDEFFSALLPLENRLRKRVTEEHSNIFILGLPRSGTTLLSQVIYSVTNCYCTNNFMARFWQVPLVGANLSKFTINKRFRDKFESHLGQTAGIDEPHEFSWFWQKYLSDKYASSEQNLDADLSQLKETILNLNSIFNAPLVFKPLELITDKLPFLVDGFQKALFVFIDRSATNIAKSILAAREKQKEPRKWWGSIPNNAAISELEKLEIIDQILYQIEYFREFYSDVLLLVPEEQRVIVRYEDLCSAPDKVMSHICKKAQAIGGTLEVINKIKPLAVKTSRDEIELISGIKEKLEKRGIDEFLVNTV
jgi:hypothetical protein